MLIFKKKKVLEVDNISINSLLNVNQGICPSCGKKVLMYYKYDLKKCSHCGVNLDWSKGVN